MLADRLQRRTTTLATRMEDTFRVRLHLPSAPGSGAALCQELRASSRRSHRPTGQPKRQERTQNWIILGGNVTENCHLSSFHRGLAIELQGGRDNADSFFQIAGLAVSLQLTELIQYMRQ